MPRTAHDEDKPMYEFTSRVRFSEVDPELNMTIPALLSRMQDCSVFHSDSVGYGVQPASRADHGWIIISWQIDIRKCPKLGEAITTRTMAVAMRGFEADRDFVITDQEGNVLAQAVTKWIYFDLIRQIPKRIPKAEQAAYGKDEGLDVKRLSRKIPIPENVTPKREQAFEIQSFQIDINGHMNNLQYIDLALMCLPKDIVISHMRVEYITQARLGDHLTPVIYEEPGRTTVALENQDGKNCAVVQVS